MSKKYKRFINEEISFLKLTIKHLIKENNEMKHKINDLKITFQSDKELLNEYYNQITDKDLKVKKLLNIIEQLKKRLNPLNNLNHKLLLKSKYLKTNNYTVYSNDDYYVTEKGISIEKKNLIKKPYKKNYSSFFLLSLLSSSFSRHTSKISTSFK